MTTHPATAEALNITPRHDMNATQKMVIETALADMFRRGRFDICALRNCLQIAKITPPGETFEQLQALHCIDFKNMPLELAKTIPEMISDCFNGIQLSNASLGLSGSTVDVEVKSVAPMPEQRKSAMARLVGWGR